MALQQRFLRSDLRLSQSAENRERISRLRTLANEFVSKARGIAKVRAEAIQFGDKRATAEDAARIAKLEVEAKRIAVEQTLPIATELDQPTSPRSRQHGELYSPTNA